jgi:uncharacterized protein with HEPN domain
MPRTNQAPKQFEAIVEYASPTALDLQALMTEHKTKSAVIRHLTSLGKSRSEVAKFMGIRYQHVRNVLTQPIKQA